MENIRTSELSVADDNTFIPQNNNFKNKSLGGLLFSESEISKQDIDSKESLK